MNHSGTNLVLFIFQAVVCNSSDPNSECSKNCDVLPRNRHRRALPYSAPVHITLLSHGPIWLTNTERVKGTEFRVILSTGIIYVVN